MSNQAKRITAILTMGLVLSGGVDAQSTSPQANAKRDLLDSFARNAPQVGDRLPAISLLDAGGKPFSLSDLRGHYSVLVGGCLT
jgi:hypothetical protein